MELGSFIPAGWNAVPMLLVGSILGLTAVGISFCFRYATLVRDVSILIDTSRSWLRGEKQFSRKRVRSAAGKSLWNLIQLARTRVDTSLHDRTSFDEILTVSSRLANPESDRVEVGTELVRLLEEFARPEAKSVVVFLLSADSSLRFDAVARSIGVTARVTEVFRRSILGKFTGDAETNSLLIDLSREPLDDVRIFGIGSVLAVPMLNQRGMVGAIVIGLATGAQLTVQRRVLLTGIAEHAALAFLAAHRAESASSEHRRERDFFLGLSHDLKSPGIRALYALRELQLTEASLSGPAQRVCRIVEDAIHEQISLIGETLDFVRYRGRSFETTPVDIEIGNLVLPMLEEFRPQALAKCISIEANLEAGLVVFCDLHHVRRIVGNLLSNSIKYTNDGGVVVRVRSVDEMVELEFEDSGIGVPDAEVDSLFAEFFRASNTGQIEGSGLGLHVVRRLAEANAGYVSYRPGPRGSVFVLRLPRSKAVAGTRTADYVPRILVVEDDPATSRMIARQLRSVSTEISIAHSLADARAAVAASKPDLVVSDGSYGDGTFADLAAHLSESCPVLLVTGDTQRASLRAYADRKHFKILEKPVSGTILLEAARSLLTWILWSMVIFNAESAAAEKPAVDLVQIEGLHFECSKCARLNESDCIVPERGSPRLDESVLIGCNKVLEHLLREQLSDRADARFPSIEQLLEFVEVVETTRPEAVLAVSLLLTKVNQEVGSRSPTVPHAAHALTADRWSPLSAILRTRYPQLELNEWTDLGLETVVTPSDTSTFEPVELPEELNDRSDGPAPSQNVGSGNSVTTFSANPNRLATILSVLALGSTFALLKFYLRHRTQSVRLSGAERAELAVLRGYFQLHGRAAAAELKQSYRRLARSVHPDVSGGDTAEFTLLQQRYRRCESLLTKQNRSPHREHLS